MPLLDEAIAFKDDAQVGCYLLVAELAFELDDAGFTVEEMSRVLYPWEVCRAVDAGYFPGEVELFDWFVRARPTSFTI